jgi:hypothetical protein
MGTEKNTEYGKHRKTEVSLNSLAWMIHDRDIGTSRCEVGRFLQPILPAKFYDSVLRRDGIFSLETLLLRFGPVDKSECVAMHLLPALFEPALRFEALDQRNDVHGKSMGFCLIAM